MVEMPRYPFMAGRKGSKNLCYKRPVPKALQAGGRPKQIWRSLKTDNEAAAKVAYRMVDEETDPLFARWREDDSQPVGSDQSLPVKLAPNFVPLTPALLRRLSDAHYLNAYDADFQWRGELWKKVNADEDAFWRGDIITLPENDWCEYRGKQYSYFACLMEDPILEDVFLYSIFRARKTKLQGFRKRYQLGDTRHLGGIADALLQSHKILVSDADRSRLMRKLMEVEIKALEDLTAGDETTFDVVVDRQTATDGSNQAAFAPPAELTSVLTEKYLAESSRERGWPEKTTLRKQGELREFLEIVGEKPSNAYSKLDGVKFKDIQLALPKNRQRKPFKGLQLEDAATKAGELRAKGEKVDLLSPLTIKDKINTVSLFFNWAKSRDASVINPVAELSIARPRHKSKVKNRHPWTIEELNRLVTAPIYAGCRSETYWRQRGDIILRHSAKYWVPLVALFSGMRLGEIIQMQVADVKCTEGIHYFDVTPLTEVRAEDDEGVEIETEEKSLKTSSSQRSVPIHQTLLDLGFEEFIEFRRQSGVRRLFPEYEKAEDDGSWSKQFSKHFKRFRESIGITRHGVKFHSLRHNVEDALRNADVRKEVRDAIQGHGESGVSREYGTGYYVKTLNEAVQKIRYDGLDLSRLKSDVEKGRAE